VRVSNVSVNPSIVSIVDISAVREQHGDAILVFEPNRVVE
jgi:hypothetical protein